MIHIEKKGSIATVTHFAGTDDDLFDEMIAFLDRVSHDDRLDELFTRAFQSNVKPVAVMNVTGKAGLKDALLELIEAIEDGCIDEMNKEFKA